MQKTKSVKTSFLNLNLDDIDTVEQDFKKPAPKTVRNYEERFFEMADSPTSQECEPVHKFKDDSNLQSSTSQLPTLSQAQKELLSEFEERQIRQALADQKRKIMEDMRTPKPQYMHPQILQQMQAQVQAQHQFQQVQMLPQNGQALLDAKPFYPT